MRNKIQVKSIWILFFITLLLSISQPHLFSGMRNYLGVAFNFAAFYYAIISKNKMKTIPLCILAVFTHFGTLPIVIMTLLLAWFNYQKGIKIFFLISLIFIFLPRGLLFENIKGFSSNEIYSYKITSYLGSENFLEKSVKEGNSNNYLRIVFNTFWYWFGLIFVFLNFKSNGSRLFTGLLAALAICNIFYSAPDIFDRINLFAEIILILCIFESISNKYSLFVNIFSIYIIFNSLFDVITLRENYFKSYVKIEVVFFPIVINSEDIQLKDFIK
jgi:hypothetical protein